MGLGARVRNQFQYIVNSMGPPSIVTVNTGCVHSITFGTIRAGTAVASFILFRNGCDDHSVRNLKWAEKVSFGPACNAQSKIVAENSIQADPFSSSEVIGVHATLLELSPFTGDQVKDKTSALSDVCTDTQSAWGIDK
jgi:hypothetical protein